MLFIGRTYAKMNIFTLYYSPTYTNMSNSTFLSPRYKIVEYQDSLHEHFIYPCHVKNGNYMPPLDNGYSIEMKEKSINTFSFPEGEYWYKKKKY